ncbi:MAG TPA: COX15/CtaA family protein [Jatrophihabitans sp.]|nr:COX15/CtaA family protein [Jatrophihabitans sp.]
MGMSWLDSPRLLVRFALASVVVNVLIVVTGGAVRLTGSGLGCPTWPSCTDGSLVPTKQYAVHGVIEFTNRQLTWVVAVVVLATLVLAVRQRIERPLAVLLAATIPAQAVLGGISVLTHLNPWVVAAHFLLSSAIIAIAFTLWWRLHPRPATEPVAAGLHTAAWAMVLLTAAVLVVGTVVTGSGPHAGASTDSGVTHRIQLAPASVAQLHADLVMLLIGVTLGFAVLARATKVAEPVRRMSWLLLLVELAQGLIGFVQYFTHVPAVLVGIHMLGACLVWLAALAVSATMGGRPFVPRRRRDRLAAGQVSPSPVPAVH